jgi:hypothetical protein
LAFCTVKLSNIRNGLRSLSLTNERGVKYPLAKLLVDIKIASPEEVIEAEEIFENKLKVLFVLYMFNSFIFVTIGSYQRK